MGVVGLELLPNGNLVLRDAENHVVWKSYDYPTDTLLLDQRLKPNAPNMLLSGEEYSSTSRSIGWRYSFELIKQRSYFSFVMHVLLNDKYSREPLIYFRDGTMLDTENATLLYVSLNIVPLT
ncbi:Epidermis-specific secreted glycoprotein EP1 [Morus notabilis]|uniref:Epidermis-specific secreted glycoprotein EP1 n=1 Tax=Morus notabilis TaxID=981085 RepID=W9RK54_9ROSA|nr:Epidermis-specific secreted glycoprotein EP1 [Morus notabilis]